MVSRRRKAADDEGSFAEFVGHAARPLLHTAELLTADSFEAEDVVQVVFARLYGRWRSLRLDDPISYARRAVVNEVTDRWRRHRGREVLRAEPPERSDPLDAYEDLNGRDAALRLLSVLTDRERAVVVLRFWEDLSEAQTAALLGVAAGTVKSTSHRALGKLRVAHVESPGAVT